MHDPRSDTAEERAIREAASAPYALHVPADKAAAPDGNRAQRRARAKAIRRQRKHGRDR